MMSFLECLVSWKVFDIVEVGFQPVSHTYIDIDQTFRTTLWRLDTHDAITLEDLRTVLSNYSNYQTTSLNEVANCSGLCQNKRCCNKVNSVTLSSWSNIQERSVRCLVTPIVEDAWEDLQTDGGPRFLKFISVFADTPNEQFNLLIMGPMSSAASTQWRAESSLLQRCKLSSNFGRKFIGQGMINVIWTYHLS